MVRPAKVPADQFLERAMRCFWAHGYHASSVERLVQATGSTRQTLYAGYGGKKGLFLACLHSYQDRVVTPAFAQVEQAGAGLRQIADFFEFQIARGAAHGLPGPGCLVANTMTELGPHDADALAAVDAHHQRLTRGFRRALRTAAPHLDGAALNELATLLTVGAQGLWSWSRSVRSPAPLRRQARTLLDLVERRIRP